MSEAPQHRDQLRKPLPFLVAWGLPIAMILSVNLLQKALPAKPVLLVIAGAYAWMGVGCVINALRCGRLHCYLSGPILLIGALLILLTGFTVLDPGPVTVMHINYATIILVILTFPLEWIWGAYAGTSGKRGNH